MSYQLIERPHKQVFSGNPVRYVFTVSNPNAPGCAMQVRLYVQGITNGSAPVLVREDTLTPNPDGTVNYYCEDYLNSQMDWQMPVLANDDVQAVTSQIKKFYIEYRQITTANPSTEWADDLANLRTVLKGGIAKEKFDRNNFFINYLPVQQCFLTWLPDKHFVGLEERRYLTYYHYYAENILLTPVLRARVVYEDGTFDVVTKAFPSLNTSKLFHCPAGLKQLGLDNLQPTKQIWYYDVSVYNDDFGTDAGDLAKPYRLYADYRKYYNVFSFVYHNSISGMDTLRIRGDWDTEINLNATDIQQATGGDFSGEILPTENASINISSYKTFDGDAGWMNTRKMQEALEDLLLSDGVYREMNGTRWLRVVNLLKSQKMGATSDTKWSFPLKWRHTFDNNYYTPFDTDFGAGVMDEAPGAIFGTCTAPSNLTTTKTDDQPAQQTWRLQWDVVADALAYDVEVTYPDGTVATTRDVVNNYFDVIATAVGDYAWRVRSKCGTNDYSGFSSGVSFNVAFAAVVCNAPANVAVDLIAINGNNADMRFTWPAVGGVVGYTIEWREIGAGVWNSHDVNALQYDVTLLKDVQYEFRVRSKCNNTPDYSGYVYGGTFIPSNLVGGCGIPTNLQVFLYTSFNGIYKAAAFSWTAGANDSTYTLQYRVKGAGTGWTTVSGINNTTYIEPFLLKNLPYEWKVFSDCTGGGISPTANGPDFITT